MISDNALVQGWVQGNSRHMDRYPNVFYSLLSGSKLKYLFFRTRFILINTVLLTIFHFFEVIYLSNFYTHYIISCIIIMRIIAAILISFWYGYTEVLRARTRQLTEIGATAEIIQQRNLWVFWGGMLGVIFCIILVVVGILLGHYMLHGKAQQLTFYWLYLAIFIFEFLIIFYLKTIYASVYAITRIYRPLWMVVTPVIINITLMLGLFHIIGLMAIIVSNLSASIVMIILSYIYTHKALRQINQSYIFLPTKRVLADFKQLLSWESFVAGMSSIFMQAEYALLIAICFISFKPYTQVLYVAIVLLEACYSLPNILYFDLKKFSNKIEYKIFEPIVKFSLKYLIFLSLLLWGIFLLVLYKFKFDLNFAIYMFWIFLFRSLLSFQQIKAFTRHKYLQIIFGGLIFLITAIILLRVSKTNVLEELTLIITVFTCGILIILWDNKHLLVKDSTTPGNPFSDWVGFYEDLTNSNSNHVLIKMKFAGTVAFPNIMDVATLIKSNIKNCKILRHDNSNLWILSKDNEILDKLRPAIIIQSGGGLVGMEIVTDSCELLDILRRKLEPAIIDSDILIPINSTINWQCLQDKHINPEAFKKASKNIYYKLKASLYQIYANNIIELNGVKYKLQPVIGKTTFLVEGILLKNE